ncbi:hypothetical protein EXIGLDRAFT_726699 [Exidia glandulosa HHB12029]|uniref:F-box domain-containing protein n=1 Tax=Exidia glandulosa HHB12029 TaxID=1314781 RepID=A0A165DLI1_EXIGL|nr:hypothetical protein EXIGLDRAFT_726699 [Exidia glandulosa HHB12029]
MATDWKAVFNARALPNMLAPETLCDVFAHLDFRNLVVASRVCRRWRNVALGDASLWTNISIVQRTMPKHEFLSQILARTKGALVDVAIEFRHGERPMLLEKCITAHMPHIRRLKLVANSQHFQWHTVWPALNVPAPELLSLTLDGVRAGYIPSELFRCSAPRLREVCLGGLVVGLFCSAFRTVQILSGTFALEDHSAVQVFPSLTRLVYPLPDYPSLPPLTAFVGQIHTFEFGSAGSALKADMRHRLTVDIAQAIPRIVAINASTEQLRFLLITFGQPSSLDISLDPGTKRLDMILQRGQRELRLLSLSLQSAGKLIAEFPILDSLGTASFSEFAVPPFGPSTVLVAPDLHTIVVRVSTRRVSAGRASVLTADESLSGSMLRTSGLYKLILLADARDGYLRVVETTAVETFLSIRLGIGHLDELVLDGVVLDRGTATVATMVKRIIALPASEA